MNEPPRYGRALSLALAVLAAATAPATAEVGPSDLAAAAARGDRARLEELARRLGAPRVAELVSGRARDARLAGITAAPLLEDGWLVLPALIAAAGEADRSIAAPAARALAETAARYDRAERERLELPIEELDAASKGCAALAGRAELAPDVRVHALECRVALGGEVAPALLGDREPEVRRAAAALSPASDALAKLAAEDPDPPVAATAAATLCAAGIAPPARVSALAIDPAVEPGLVIRLLPCLTEEDRKALRAKGPRAVREWLRRRK